MCGIVGLLGRSGHFHDATLATTVQAMADTLAHRGPDGEGVWEDQSGKVAFGHRRLAIIDLSPAGQQPMVSRSGRLVICYNGEVYNFKEIRKQLEANGCRFRGHSDTEVLLEACENWGVEKAVGRIIGMFAFALWDQKERLLYLVRDRLGIKPLYWAQIGPFFIFGSELKAFHALPCWEPKIDRQALALYLRLAYVPAPHTIFRGVNKLEPGSILMLGENQAIRIRKYWDMHALALEGSGSPSKVSGEEAAEQLNELLLDAVSRRMVADVPLGAFLSGGIDSSTVVALMQAQNSRPVKTFTIAFPEKAYNEAEHANAVAKHLETDHTELRLEWSDALRVIPELGTLYDEPFADPSQIPTVMVSRLARQHVAVSLSGDGGDEVFGGYNRYFWGRRIWHTVRWIPIWIRLASARALVGISPDGWGRLLRLAGPISSSELSHGDRGDKLHKFARALGARTFKSMYLSLVSQCEEPASLVIGGTEPATVLTDGRVWAESWENITQRIMYLDTVTYLPGDILVKLDRASMACSLEARVPLLDHRVVEYAWKLPISMKLRDGSGKWLLRQILYKYVPKNLFERPKMGFAVPIGAWLRGPLRDWAEALLNERRLVAQGYLRPGPIRERWIEHLSGRRNWQYCLWTVLMFQAWLDEWMARDRRRGTFGEAA